MKKLLSINIGSMSFRKGYDAACESLGIDSTVIRSRNCCFVLDKGNVSLLHKGVEIFPEEYGEVFVRVRGRFALMTSLIAQFFKARGISLCDDIYLGHTANDEKITQMLLFTLAGVPIPRTVLFTLRGFTDNQDMILKSVSFPCVLKTNGSRGRNVWKMHDTQELESAVLSIGDTSEVAMIQEFIPNTYDIRAICMYGDVIGAIRRSSADGFLNNVSQGSIAEPIALTDEESAIVKKCCDVLGRTFTGVDVVRTTTGPLVFEANLGPQFFGFESATGIDVPKELLERIKNKLG